MASKIKVDTLETANGSGTIALSNQLSGMTGASMPSGSVLQVVSYARNITQNGGYFLESTSNSMTASTFGESITPTSTSSKIFVFISTHVYSENTVSDVTIFRDSTNLGGAVHGFAQSMGIAFWKPLTMQYLDSPNTTSAVTYKVGARATTSGGTVYIGADSDTVNVITLMEIQG